VKLKSILLLAILIGSFGVSVVSGDIETDGWTVPDCDHIQGAISITYTSDDGATVFDPKPGNAEVATVGLVALDVDNTLMTSVYDGYGAEILRSEDAGCTWTPIELPHMRVFLEIIAAPGGIVYAWDDGTTTLFRIEGDVIVPLQTPDGNYGMAVDPADAMHIRFGGTGCQLYESFDGGESFSPIGNPAFSDTLPVFTVDFAPGDWDCVLCGTKGAWRTADGGNKWASIEPFDAVNGDFVYGFAFSPDNLRRVWARANMNTNTIRSVQILVSNDGGRRFVTAIREGDEAIDQYGQIREVMLRKFLALAPRPGQPDVLYFPFGSFVGARNSDLFRYDVGTNELTVKHVSDDFQDIGRIAFSPADPQVMYLGVDVTHPKATNPGIEPTEDAEAVSVSVYPNPFNPAANISFRLAEAMHVKLEIYNVMGQKVGTLVDDNLSAGEYTRKWDGSQFASGVYMYRLQAGETVQTAKMVLLK